MSNGHGGPAWVPGGSNTPDWGALAADEEKRRARKRSWAIIGSAVAAVAVGAVVAFAIVSQSGDESTPADGASSTLPDPSELPSGSSDAEPSFNETSLPPVPETREFISDKDKDLAPFEPETFFAGEEMSINDRTYFKAATHAAADCAEGATAELGTVLTEQGCAALIRATYTGGPAAVTIGVAQFPTEEAAVAARQGAADGTGMYLLALTGGEAPTFCGNGGCRTTNNQVGRYVYFTIAGNADNTPDSGEDTPAQRAARDGNDHAFARIIQRGEAQASASASALVEERRRQQQENDEA